MKLSHILSSDAEIVSGAVVFKGTRVPVSALFDNLAGGMSLKQFIDNFPTVELVQAERAVVLAGQLIEARFRAVKDSDS